MSTNQHPVPSTKSSTISNILLILGLSIVLFATGYFGYRLHELSVKQEQIKQDYSTVNNITFGVFSVDIWSEKLANVVTREIKDFKITPEQKRLMQKAVTQQLHAMINDVIKEFNKPQKSIGGKLKKFAFRQFVEPKELHAQVPAFSKLIVDRITSPKATAKIKGIALSKFDELVDQTYDSTKVAINAVTGKLYAKYSVTNNASFNKKIEASLVDITKQTTNYTYAILGLAALMIVLWILLRKKINLHTSLFVMSLLIALILLAVGVSQSIIEVDARLSSLHILLMGEKISFENQVLFYQSKSILGIAEVLITQSKPDSVTVGVIILLFVVTLPALRILARGIHMLCKPVLSENAVTRYLAFDSEKWDMADVMVVGILMTYIGLNGILKSQLTDLNMKTEFMESSTVNYSSLQPGYIIFVGYVVFAIFLSHMLKKISCK